MQTELIGPRPLGRPKDLEKRGAIIDAASRLFAVRGVDGVAIEAIAAEAGVSKVTIYANFKDKSAILEAIVLKETGRLGLLLLEVSSGDGSLAERLTKVGEVLVNALNDPGHVAMDRCLSVAAVQHPALGQQFFHAGPGHLRDLLCTMLTEAAATGEISASDPMTAAEDLLGLWFGFRTVEKRFMCSESWSTEKLTDHIHRTVGLFLRAHAPNRQPG